MKRLILGLLLIAVVGAVPSTIDAKKKTTRKKSVQEAKYDALSAAERKIVGKHMLSLQWISWNYFGSVTIKREADGTLSCKGEQLARNCKDAEEGCKTNGDYVKLDGIIDIVDASHLVFVGEIRTKIFHINNGQEVLREGAFHFDATGNRKYWRLQEMRNPVDECVDYVDIYFK